MSGVERSVSTHNHSSTLRQLTSFHPPRQLELTGQHGSLDMTDVDVEREQ
jgi:hypothetical protein